MDYDLERFVLTHRRPRRPKKYSERINMDGCFFRERFRLNIEEFNYVLDALKPIICHPSLRNFALSPKQQILVTLRFLGTGGSLHLVGHAHGVSKATMSRCIHRVVTAINTCFFEDTIRFWYHSRQSLTFTPFQENKIDEGLLLLHGRLKTS